jgi:hypothetical protein
MSTLRFFMVDFLSISIRSSGGAVESFVYNPLRAMRFPPISVLLAAVAIAAGPASAQQGLVCAGVPAGRPCEAFHYHVQMYRPDTKQFVDVTGNAPFATQAACERAREAQVAANKAVVDFFKTTKQQQYEADRIGPCHCDMTGDRSSPSYLPDVQRELQLRAAEEARLRVRERLLDNKVPTDSTIMRGLYIDPPGTPLLAGSRLVPLPQTAPVQQATSTDDLRLTRTIDTSKPTVAALDLPLVDIGAADGAPPAPPAAAVPGASTPAPAPAHAAPAQPISETVVEAQAEVELEPKPEASASDAAVPQSNDEDVLSAEETAERFISYETQRITNVLKASAAINDETMKSKIFEACMQRIQLLSNLRLLIEGSGMRSRLTSQARKAESESDRLSLIRKLFGDEIETHWAPRDAADVILDVDAEVAEAPERALRDTTGRFSSQQKKRALYLVLAQTQPTEDQRLWLSTVVEGFLR